MIISDSQITTSDNVSPVSYLRPFSNEVLPFTTNDTQLNITIVMTNNDYPSAPQIGKIDIIEQQSTLIGNYEVYFKSSGSNVLVPFNSNPSATYAEIFNSDQNILFPDNIFVDEILVVVNKNPFSLTEIMKIKIDIFACFEKIGK